MANDSQKPAKDGRQSASRLFGLVVPKLPLITKTTLLHSIGATEQSKYLDLRSALTVAVLRAFLDTPKPTSIAKAQAQSIRDQGIKGRIWISKVASQVPPETSIREALLSAVEGLKPEESKDAKVPVPEIVSVEAEWTGHRANAAPDSRLPEVSEEEKYKELMKEVKSPVTVLYFHGGAYYLCDPSSHRAATKRLAKLTQGRCYSVRYRLSPQAAFPTAILDALVSYFTLLYPPPGSVHEAVDPKHIVFAGDSAGGNLSLALLRTLMEIRRQNLKITWFGEEREVPLPAGAAVNAPWLDLTMGFPSWQKNQQWDYTPDPIVRRTKGELPSDAIWPTSPPRKHPYADDSLMNHPLVCLQMVQDWAGAPPIYVCCGWENLADEDLYFVNKLHRDGVPVVFEQYEAMPHVFCVILAHTKESNHCYEQWSGFIKKAATDPAAITSSFASVQAKTCKESPLDVTKLTSYSDQDVKDLLYKTLRENSYEVPPQVAAKL